MHSELGGVILAGVAHNNPNYDPGWSPFFAALIVIAGCAIVIAGGAVSIGMRRLEGRRTWGGQAVGPGILTIGLAIAALGVGLL
ncbi:hypothetical protein [Streptomyces gibsoniae]|uniref:Integral membrane protein n=1 Tax=Streptomyces gibsoniae TaxID=3075529 RepID=A0ABU2U2D1_9ACTN|nr:hypothetical protein [Streptomyces sp. DSM 41699]MDT0467250.1 hypothetical protein [Streptomyces sp. DSM 41699]